MSDAHEQAMPEAAPPSEVLEFAQLFGTPELEEIPPDEFAAKWQSLLAYYRSRISEDLERRLGASKKLVREGWAYLDEERNRIISTTDPETVKGRPSVVVVGDVEHGQFLVPMGLRLYVELHPVLKDRLRVESAREEVSRLLSENDLHLSGEVRKDKEGKPIDPFAEATAAGATEHARLVSMSCSELAGLLEGGGMDSDDDDGWLPDALDSPYFWEIVRTAVQLGRRDARRSIYDDDLVKEVLGKGLKASNGGRQPGDLGPAVAEARLAYLQEFGSEPTTDAIINFMGFRWAKVADKNVPGSTVDRLVSADPRFSHVPPTTSSAIQSALSRANGKKK